MKPKEFCTECGIKLMKELGRRRSDTTISFKSEMLPDTTPRRNTVVLTVDKLKAFNDNLEECLRFAAWVVGVPVETFCLFDKMRFISRVIGINQLSREPCEIDERLIDILEIANERCLKDSPTSKD